MDNKVFFMSDLHMDVDQIMLDYNMKDVVMTMQVMIKSHGMILGDEFKKPIDYTPYFRVEGYKRRGKGTVYRVVRIRDEQIIHRLVKSKGKAEAAARLMVEIETKIVEREVERTILG